MKNSLLDRNLVRQYLLGRLDDNDELENQLSEEVLINDELCETVDSIEEEIIDEYLDGTLGGPDKSAVENYFLRPPERQMKLNFAKLLRHHYETKRNYMVEQEIGAPVAIEPDARSHKNNFVPVVHKWSNVLIYGQVAALILLSVLSLTYISSMRKKQAIVEHALVLERERFANRAPEVRRTDSSMVALTLATDRSRGSKNNIPYLEISPSIQRIIVEIALQDGAMRTYNVRVETAAGGEPIWSATLFPIRSDSGDARLLFDVPAQRIESGAYSVVVATIGSARPGSIATMGTSSHYDFQIKVIK